MLSSEYSNDEILKFALESGMLDASDIQAEMDMKNRREYLEMHNYEIWQGKNGSWYTYLPDEEKGRVLRKRKTRDAIYDVVVKYYDAKDNEPTVEQCFQRWISSKLAFGEIQKQTYDRYKTDFDRFFSESRMGKRKIRLVTENELEEFIKMSIKENRISNKAYRGLRTIVFGMFKYARKNHWTDISITNFMGDLEISRKSFRKVVKSDEESVFTDSEVQKIIDFIINNKTIINLGILLCFQTGIRVGELAALMFSDIHGKIMTVNKTEIRYRGDDGKYVFEVRESAKTEAGNRNIILNSGAAQTIQWIKEANQSGIYMFEESGVRVKEKAFIVKIGKICKHVNIPHRSMHKIRKTYATKLINAGVDERIIIKQLGHTNISCTKNYYYFNNKTEEEAERQIESAVSY